MYKRLIILLCLCYSCSNELQVNSENSGLPVIYFILDPFEEVYQATITQLTNNDQQNPFETEVNNLIQPDQLQFTLELWNDSVRLWYTGFHYETIEKVPGVFTDQKAFVMVSDATIPKKDETDEFTDGYPEFSFFRIQLSDPQFNQDAYAKIPFGNYPSLKRPGLTDQNVNLYDQEPFIIEWDEGENVTYYDLYFNLHYSEALNSGAERITESKFLYATNVQPTGDNYKVYMEGDKYFKRMGEHFPMPEDDVDYRKLISFDIVLVGGDNYFAAYQTFSKLSHDNSFSSYSNISNGMGLFALKYVTKKEFFNFHPITKDSLVNGQYTQNLGFVKW